MNKLIEEPIEILDCTIRDGGYVNNWDFDRKIVRETYRALSRAGVDYVELGYHGTEKYFDKNKYGSFRFCYVEDINQICEGISGSKVSLMVDYGGFDVSDLKQYQNSPVKLIRLAFHKNMLEDALRTTIEIKKLGFAVSVNLMGFTSYSVEERSKLVSLLEDTSINYVYVVDSYGSMFPNQVTDFFKPLLKTKNIKLGFHSHNNLQMAFANTLAAIESDVSIIDSSIYGMGRGAGNLQTEIILAYLQLLKPGKYNVIPVLNLIDHYYLELQRNTSWGYNLPYMLSGIYDCHPNYSKNLIERKEYDIEDIWKILNIVKNSNQIGFKKELLDDILKRGFFSRKSFVVTGSSSSMKIDTSKVNVKYTNRHLNSDFLVLANGPSLKSNIDKINKFINKYHPVILAANYIGELIHPQYHAFSNKRRFIDYIDMIDKNSKLLIGQYIPDEMIREYTEREYETIYYEDVDAPFAVRDGVITTNCRTVSLLLLGVAVVMGAKRIFVAGLDGYMGSNDKEHLHFYMEKDETENREILLDKHLSNLRYLEQIDEYMFSQGKEGIHIITPTNYNKFYKGIENYI